MYNLNSTINYFRKGNRMMFEEIEINDLFFHLKDVQAKNKVYLYRKEDKTHQMNLTTLKEKKVLPKTKVVKVEPICGSCPFSND